MTQWRFAMVMAVTFCMVLPVFAQVDDDGAPTTLQERREAGMYYDRELQRWFPAEDTGSEPTDEGRLADTSVPGWEYDPETRLWYDTERPGWAWDPVIGRWYSSERPGQAYDMRSGRWYPDNAPGTYYDANQRRWYYDPAIAEERGLGREVVPYFDEETGRWREEPASWRYYDESGRYTSRYCTVEGEPIDPSELMGGDYGPAGAYGASEQHWQQIDDLRRIADGTVMVAIAPADLRPGQATLAVAVEGAAANQAQVSGYLYPAGTPQRGMGVEFMSQAGTMYSDLQLPSAGEWELALRISRPGFEDELVYYPLDVQQ